MITAGEIADLTGETLLEVVNIGQAVAIHDIAFVEFDEEPLGVANLLLAVGVTDIDLLLDVLKSGGRAEVAGLVVKEFHLDDPRVLTLAKRLDLTLLKLQPTVSWTHLALILRGMLDHGHDIAGTGEAVVHNELFEAADAIAKVLDGPVTIEDTKSRVLAYSLHHEGLDSARVSTIVGRKVPEQIIEYFRSRGVFRKIANSDQPIFVPAGPDGTLPRLVVPVRSGGKWLGSIWAIVPNSTGLMRVSELQSASRLLAMHLLRAETYGYLSRRVRVDQIRQALQIGGGELDIPGSCWRVVAFHSSSENVADSAEALAIFDTALRRAGWSDPLLADFDDAIFGIVRADTLSGRDGEPRVGSWDWLASLVREHGSQGWFRVFASEPLDSVRDLPLGLAQARELSAVAKSRVQQRAAVYEHQWHEIIISRALQNLSWQTSQIGPIQELMRHDVAHGSDYLNTLRILLARISDQRGAAEELHIHVNTLRYRLRKITELLRVDLTDPDVRLALQLQLEAARSATTFSM